MSTVRPRNGDDLTPAELAGAAIDMDLVLEREPQLSDNGFKRLRGRRPQAEHEAKFIQWRENMRAPRSLAQFMAARSWLRQFSKIKSLNRRGSSYGLKHVAEDDIGYTTNGCFIAGAIAEGFTVRRVEFGSPNAWFNISTEAWRHTERGREARRRLAGRRRMTDTLESVCAETRRFDRQFDNREPTKADRYADKMDALHNKAARLFAKRRGWKATVPRQLLDIDGLNELRGPGWPRPLDDDWWALDHSWVFLDPHHPFITAFVAQPYDYEPEEYLELTGRLGLRMENLGTKLSWHLPGSTTLLVFTRRPVSSDALLDQLRAAEPQSREEYALAWQWLCLNFPTFPQASASPETVRKAAREAGMSEWAVGILTARVRTAPPKEQGDG